MLAFAIGAFEGMGTGFTLLCFESRRGDFVVGLAALYKFSVVDSLMWAVTFNALCPLDSANACSVAPFPAIFVLGDAWVYVSTTNGCDESSYVEILVNE